MSREMQKRMSIIIGAFLVIVMGATAILPAIRSSTRTQTADATPLPSPEPFPQPIANDSLDFSARYLHPSALYTLPIPQPIGWNQIIPSNEAELARTTLRSDLNVIEVYVRNAPGLTPDDLPDQFSAANLEQTWRNYQQVERRGPGEMRDDRFYVDYDLTLNRRLFNARHLAWTDGSWLYVVRVVGPSNAIEQTIFLAERMAAELESISQYHGDDAGWSAHFDAVAGYAVRFPRTWELQDSAPGRPASIAINDAASLRLEGLPSLVTSEVDARALLAATRADAQLLSIEAWEDGIALSFAYETALGEERSGAWLLIPNVDETTIRAEISIAANAIDLLTYTAESPTDNDAQATPEDTQYREMLAALRSLQPVSWDYITQDALASDEDGLIVLPASD